MAFNWFRRRFDQKAPETENPAAEEVPSIPTVEEEPPAAAEDYLSWAKAAYKNIQQQAQAAPESSTASSEVEEAPAQDLSAKPAPEPAVNQTEDAPAVNPDLEPIATKISNSSPAEILVETPATAAFEEDVLPASLPEAPLNFFARAEAERESRLQRLRETAIEEPEPEVSLPLAATTNASQTEEAITLDEGFLWSAEILSAQGRRADEVSLEEITWLRRLRQGLDKTRRSLVNQLKAIVGQGPLNADAVVEIEALLLQADVGVEATDKIISALQQKLREEVLPPDAAIAYLKQILRDMLDTPLNTAHSATFAPEKDSLNIWLLTGVNGAGKTTTLGKIAYIAQESGYRCLIAAADTFRAAAVEQVRIWGQRSGIEVVANPGKNTDPAAVVFDAITAAAARETELLLVDTAGRLQNKKNLMDELTKVRRIIDKKAPAAKIESLLVLDATLGQNGLRQAQVFSEAAQLTGVVLTKLDGTAKGGIALAVVQQLGLPIRFIGAGEGIKDLRPFSSYEFVEALLSG